MKTIIYYKTNTGFTYDYVELLKPRIECEKDFDVKKINKKDILENKNIIFMGPLRNNVILGLNKFFKKYKYMKDKNVFIFAVGMEPYSQDKKDNVIMSNALQEYHVRLYLLPGGFDLSRMKPLKRWFFKRAIKIVSKSHPELNMINGRTINMVEGRNLDNMVDVYYKVNREY
jgi:hypothetical protein